MAAMARRAGSHWFVAAVNGDAANTRTLPVSLSFLGPGGYHAVLLGDLPGNSYGFNRCTLIVGATDTLNVCLQPGGGFVGMFTSADRVTGGG